MGGGDLLVILIALFFACPFLKLKAIELSKLCNSGSCEIKTPQSEVTNNSLFTTNNQIKITTQVQSFKNYGTIKSTASNYPITIDSQNNYIAYFYNYGRIETTNQVSLDTTGTSNSNSGYRNIYNYGYISGYIYIAGGESGTTHITNYGTMGGAIKTSNNKTIYVNNYGTINLCETNGGNGCTKKAHFKDVNLVLQDYAMKISEKASVFNAFSGNATDNSHLVLDSVNSVNFADSAKLILDFGSGFEFGAEYKLDKLIVKADNGENALNVDFDRLMPKSDIYTLIQSGEYFIARLQPQHSTISNISKSNIRTMNNFYTLSNSMIYPRKLYHSQNLGKKNQNNLVILRERSDRRISKSNIIDSSPLAQNDNGRAFARIDNGILDSANPLKSYESFSYRNESVNRRIQRQNKRNYNRRLPTQSNSQNLNADSANKNNLRDSANYSNSMRQTQNLKETQRFSQNLAQNLNYSQTPNNYYFILTPFFNYNSFTQSGNYNLRGFDYGFLTAFSTQVAESNNTISSLGAHFIFSYGNIGDSKDKDLSIKSLNLNLGLNYKLDLIYDMYLKARGDFYYLSNTLDSATIKNIKPNNLGFGVSVAYGKDFDFKEGGILGIEAGIDYKALKTNEVSLNSQTYKSSLYNLIYADVGLNYSKYFGGFGLNLGTGFKANLAPKLAESALLVNSQTLKFTLDNDKYLGYANAGISYLLNARNFDMEFSLAYYGNFGDRVISNGAGVEWRVFW